MPTPSAPDPRPPISFSSTCPDIDDASRQAQQQQQSQQQQPHDPQQQHEPPRVVTTTSSSDEHHEAAMPPNANDTPSQPIDIAAPSSLFAHSDGPVDALVPAPSPLLPSAPAEAYHKAVDDEATQPSHLSYTSSPVEPLQTSRPRQGVGTASRLSAGHMDVEEEGSGAGQKWKEPESEEYVTEDDYSLPSMGARFPSKRMIPVAPSSFLRAGSRFTGTQQSERQMYQVQVEIKYVDLRESFLCGYLRIQGLTDEHPTLTTYFEGEIINGTTHSFLTAHPDWGANDKTDLSHWAKFPAFRPYSKQARRHGLGSAARAIIKDDVAQSEHIFMRWKEHFLVPDHRVRTITGASFEGFYYICFNQVLGEVNGIYFHSKSERFQQLELKHVADRGCFSALEFR